MAKNGGYRKPAKPAAVSGPGKYSKRTDGQPSEDNMKQAKRYVTGMDYGDNKELNEIQSQGDLAAGPSVANTPTLREMPMTGGPQSSVAPTEAAAQAAPAPMPRESVTSIFAPTSRPNEPITAGLAVGDGPGPEALTGTPEFVASQEDNQRLAVMYGILQRAATSAGASSATKELARRVRGLMQ
jgi:hypothetical protein